jgi:hypothetical protein
MPLAIGRTAFLATRWARRRDVRSASSSTRLRRSAAGADGSFKAIDHRTSKCFAGAEARLMGTLFADTFLVDEARAFNFFSTSLDDVLAADTRRAVSRAEFLYVASILAHYSFVEAGAPDHLPIPGTLRQLHDLFVTDFDTWHDAGLMETAAAQALMLTGYFAGGMRPRHSLRTYVWWGQFFYDRAASGCEGEKRALLQQMSHHFPLWRQQLERLHGHLWESQLLMRPVLPLAS